MDTRSSVMVCSDGPEASQKPPSSHCHLHVGAAVAAPGERSSQTSIHTLRAPFQVSSLRWTTKRSWSPDGTRFEFAVLSLSKKTWLLAESWHPGESGSGCTRAQQG